MLEVKAYAKVNLGLDVVRRREDGYHEVKMVMQTVDLYDVLTFEITENSGIYITTNKKEIPTDENNLIYKAAKLLTDEFSIDKGVKIHLEKNIPVAAGMAGGSTDAAAVFTALNEIFALNLTEEELMKRAVKVGADVPYCIMGGTALSEGIGEILTELSNAPECKILIVKPPIDVSTKYVYENLHANELKYHPDIDGMVNAINKKDLYGMCEKMDNVLETVTVKKYPVIEKLKTIMKDNGAVNSIMSGSGPTVFGLFDDLNKAQVAFEEIKKTGISNQVYLTDLINRRK